MNDLIGRKALLEAMVNIEEGYEYCMTEPSFATAYRVVRNQPTVDAVEVVRCKDCKYKRKLRDNDNLIYCNVMCIDMALDAFCSHSEKMDGGERE